MQIAIGLGVDLLAVEVGGDLLAALRGELLQRLLGHGQHAAGAAGPVIEQIGAGFDLVGDGQEDELRHQPHGIARGPVLARLLVVLLVEPAHQLLEDRAHAVIVEAGMADGAVGVHHGVGAQVDVGRGELLDQRAERVGPGEARDLVAELEAVEDVLHVGREPVEPGPEVGLELLAARAGAQIAQGEPGGVVEGLPRRLAEGGVLPHHAGLVERGLHVENGLLTVLQHRVQPPQHGHRQDHIAILAAHIEVAQHVVRDAPDVARDPVEVAVAHLAFILRYDSRRARATSIVLQPTDWWQTEERMRLTRWALRAEWTHRTAACFAVRHEFPPGGGTPQVVFACASLLSHFPHLGLEFVSLHHHPVDFRAAPVGERLAAPRPHSGRSIAERVLNQSTRPGGRGRAGGRGDSA